MIDMIGLGQRMQQYKVEAWDDATSTWKQIAQGTTIGYCKLDRIPKVKASKVRLTIVEALACPTVKSFGIHLDMVSATEGFEPANANGECKRISGTRN